MIVGVLKIDLAVYEARTLKDKRRLVSSCTQRMSDRFNVSVCETDFRDSAKRCQLGVAIVDREARSIHARLDKIVELVRRSSGLTLLDYQRELL